jgi:hypothetical protein
MSQEGMHKKSTDTKREENPIRFSMVLAKGLLLFIVLNLLFALIGNESIGKFSLYNHIFPGRLRLPFGENPAEAYSFSLNNLDAMFASHEISGKGEVNDEFRILVIGDSSTWGILLKPEETLVGLINKKGINCQGKRIRAYNLGYPTLSLTKDVMILDQGMSIKPDLIIWPVTLEAFPIENQFSSPLVAENMDHIERLSKILPIPLSDPIKREDFGTTIYEKSIVGQRRNLADLLRLQLYGSMWAATGIDQVYPLKYEHAQLDLKDNISFHEWTDPDQLSNGLAMDILKTGSILAGEVPMIIVNEPILISQGINSDLRYNFYYPRWAYDQYRKIMEDYNRNRSWQYLDLWNKVPPSEFTNSAIHMTPVGELIYSGFIIDEISASYCN